MKLEKWAMIAEVLSGIAVTISVIFLVVGIRDNTNVTRAAVYEDLINGINQLNIAILQDDELSLMWSQRFDYYARDMSEEEFARLNLMNRVLLRIYEAAYFSSKYGTLGESEWERFAATICTNYRELSQYPQLWSRVSGPLSAEFQEEIVRLCR